MASETYMPKNYSIFNMKKLALLFVFLWGAQVAFSQNAGRTISGVVKDSAGVGVLAATVKLKSATDSMFTRTDLDGKFTLRNVKVSQFVLSITSLGYKALNKKYLYKEGTSAIQLDPIVLRGGSIKLNAVVVSGTMPITVKEDTVEYRAKDYPVRENSVVEDVLKKLPGVEVDKDGNVTSQGKSITRVRVNGKDFFDGDLKTATQNLPAEIIEKIQLVDDYGDQANISGIKSGDPEKILNITIAPENNKGFVANVAAGGGYDARKESGNGLNNDFRGMVNGMAQIMNNNRQVAVLLNLNNTNASLFDFQGGGNQRGGRFRMGGGGGRFSGGSGGSGITSTQAGGFNYRDQWSKKLSVYGSYSIQNRDNDVMQNSFSQTTVPGSTAITNNSTSNTLASTISHRFNFNLEYKIDSLNYLKISPSFNYTGTTTDGRSNSVIEENSRQDQSTDSYANSKAPSVGVDVLYNHRFMKRGRNISYTFSVNNSYNKNNQDIKDEFRFYSPSDLNLSTDSTPHRLIATDNKRFNLATGVKYSEPLSVHSRLDFSYDFNRSSYDNSRITQLEKSGAYVPADSLSNVFDYSFMTNQFGVNYRYDREKLYNFTFGVTAQPTLLEGRSKTNGVNVKRTGFNLFPNARFVYNFAKSRALQINYNGSSSEPSYSQIQPVVDLTNPQRPIVGNPDLSASFTQNLSVRYNNFDPEKGTFFILGLSGNTTNDRIVSNLVRVRQPVITGSDTTYNLIQETRYLNTDGYYAANGFYAWSKPFSERKYTLRLNGSANYTHDVSYTDNQRNIGKTYSFSQGARFQINPNQDIDITPGVTYTHSWVNYSLPTSFDTKNSTLALQLNAKIYFFKTWILGVDGSKNLNYGYSGNISSNPFIINSYIEKELMNRKARLRLQGYDLLNQALAVTNSQSDNTYTQSATNRLTRYFLFSFAYRFSKFAGKTTGDRPDDMMRPPRDFRGGGGRPPMF